jgi:transcriptional regulator with XRE-family HTH domain
MKGVQGTPESREQLHAWMDESREELRLTWADIARDMGMTEENLLRIRKGRISISMKAAKRIADALQWEHGSVEAAVLEGRKPRSRTSAPSKPGESQPVAASGDTLTGEDEVRLRVLKDAIRAEGMTDELRLALLRYLFESAGGKLTPATLDMWLNDPNRLEAIRADANRNETEQVTPSELS